MKFDFLRRLQTPFKGGDKLIFKYTRQLPVLDVHVTAKDFLFRYEEGYWKLHKDFQFQDIKYADVQIRQMLSGIFDFDETVVLTDEDAERFLDKIENGEKSW